MSYNKKKLFSPNEVSLKFYELKSLCWYNFTSEYIALIAKMFSGKWKDKSRKYA